MTSALVQCKQYLESRYRTALNLQSGFAKQVGEDGPAWLWVTIDDIFHASAQESGIAALVDPEIGTLLYFVEYGKEQQIVPLVVKALSVRSRLLFGGNDPRRESAPRDSRGSWRVALYWLIGSEGLLDQWQRQMALLRAEAPHMEEIPMDCVANLAGDWQSTFQDHGFPRLLLQSRKVLRIKNRVDVERWSAADSQVEAALQGFAKKFSDRTQKELAGTVEQELQRLKDAGKGQKTAIGKTASSLKRLGVKNFRNIRDANLELGADRVSCSVITGPNGSGKSTLFEVISLATFGSSSRYLEYLRDKDVGTRTPEDYIKKYVRNVENPQWADPALILDGIPTAVGLPRSESEAVEIDRLSEGSLFSQERSARFCQRSASDLAAEVLRGYSDIANGLQWYVDDEYQKANRGRQDLLRSLSLSANITKVDTAHLRVALKRLEAAIPYATTSLVAWLSIASRDYQDLLPPADGTLKMWQRWNDEKRKTDVAKQCVAVLEQSLAEDAVSTWIGEYSRCVEETLKMFGGHVSDAKKLVQADSKVLDDLRLWGRWAEGQVVGAISAKSSEVTEARKQLADASKRQALVVKRGTIMRGRIDHLNSVKATVVPGWLEEHGATCITCNTDLKARGGLLNVMEALLGEAASERARLEDEYKKSAALIRELNERLAKLGIAEHPLEEHRRDELVRAFSPFLVDGMTLSAMLTNEGARERLIGLLNHLKVAPPLPPKIEVTIANEIAKEIIQKCIDVSVTFNAPNNWAAIRKRVAESLGETVKSHLPNTLESLWLECVLNLTSAPWMLRQRPTFHVKTQRNDQSLTIRVGKDEEGPLARHILNQAEVHILGLSWFFVRYCLHGRFNSPYMVLDDPAQEMDQTTYRDLCRLLETYVRVHRAQDTPLNLVLMFHQEDRALDAARALNATLTSLSWADVQTAETIRNLRVTSDELPLSPAAVLA